jgi:hypothetical protein
MPLIKSPSKKAFKKNVETEMKANPSPKDRKQNLAIAYAVKRRNMAKGGSVSNNPKLEQSELFNKGPELYSDEPDMVGCPVCNSLSKGTLCEEHGASLEKNTSGQYPKEDTRYMHEGGQLGQGGDDPKYLYEGGQLDDQRSPDDEPNQELPTPPQYDETISPRDEVAPEMSLLKADEHSLKSMQLHEQAMAKRKLANADALHLAKGGRIANPMNDNPEQLEGKDSSEIRAHYRKMADGGNVAPAGKNEHEDLSPGKPEEWMDAPSNDFMKHPDQPEVADAEHDAGSVDEEMDESLSGQVLRKRRSRR